MSIDPAIQAGWDALLASAPPPAPKGVKPSPEEIKLLQEFRGKKQEFLANLSEEDRAVLQAPKAPQQQKKKEAPKTDSPEILAALREFAVPGQKLVDIGANLQDRFTHDQIETLLIRAGAAGVSRVVLTGCDLAGSRKGHDVAEWWSEHAKGLKQSDIPRVYYTAGVHPHDASKVVLEDGSMDPSALKELTELASNPLCVSLGEAGLDYDRMFSPRDVQLTVFEAQVALCESLGRPLFAHVREQGPDKGEALGVYKDVIEILDRHKGITPEQVCVHCFTGDGADLEEVTSRGLCVGFTGYLGMAKRATSTGTLAALARPNAIDLSRVMIETDSPFMMPDKSWLPADISVSKGKSEPAIMPAVCRALAEAIGCKADEVAAETTRTAERFFQFDAADSAVEAASSAS